MGVPPRKTTQRATLSAQSHSTTAGSSGGGESHFTALQAQRRRQTAAGTSSTPSSPTAAAAAAAAAALLRATTATALTAGSGTVGVNAAAAAAAAAQDRPDKLEFDVLMSIVTMAAVAEGGAPLVMLVDSAQHMDEQVRCACRSTAALQQKARCSECAKACYQPHCIL
jgi:hypothetical protein